MGKSSFFWSKRHSLRDDRRDSTRRGCSSRLRETRGWAAKHHVVEVETEYVVVAI